MLHNNHQKTSNIYSLVVLSVLVLSGCGGKRHRSPLKGKRERVASLKEYEARLHDVPIPVGAIACDGSVNPVEKHSDVRMVLSYRVPGALNDVIRFYHEEMERLGWKVDVLGGRVNTHIGVFSKPSRIVVVSACSHGSYGDLCLFVQ